MVLEWRTTGVVMGERDDLAPMLLALKERSGLSYGVIGRRLHMGTSTVHRYCNGDAVPQDFASVERFGRLCQATPDELAELHRRWVLADRQRSVRQPASPIVVLTQQPQTPIEDALTDDASPRHRSWWVLAAIAIVTLAVTVPLTLLTVGDKNSPVAIPPPSATAQAAVPAPLDVSVTPFTLCSRNILVNRDPAHVPPTVDLQDTPAWVSAMDGVVTGNHDLAVTIQGTGDRTVVLESLNVRTISSDDPPTTGNVYELGSGCGGGVDTSIFDVNLDMPHPKPSSPKKHSLPLKTSADDPVVLQVAAHAQRRDVTWFLEVNWSSGGERGTLRIDDEGKPFRTTGAKERPLYWYDYDGRQWLPETS
jgi:hypothetical protein